MSFAHLHCHTEYSLLDSSNKIKEYVNRVKELKMTAAAITDHGNMYGAVEFYKAMKAEGLNPILGCEVYVAPESRFDKEAHAGDDRYYHLVLLAENNTGYQNLIKIVSIGFTEGFYYKPRVDFETLEKYHEGIIALSACLAGEVPRTILRFGSDAAKDVILKYQKIFGKDNYFLELQDHGIADQQSVNAQLVKLSRELEIPLVATNDCHYTNKSDASAHDLLICMQTNHLVTDEDRMRYQGEEFYVKSEEEMLAIFPYAKEAVENTGEIAKRCHVELEFGNYRIPPFELPIEYDSAWTYLNALCEEGFEKRYPAENKKNSQIYQKMQYELEVIKNMGFIEYILIVWEYINWAKTHDCMVGPGRGSAAGSVVCYCIGITDIDPIKYNLLFERFLNPERVSMPDIDVDFEYTERQRVIDTHIVERYGKDNVTQISTFQTMAARAVIKDVGRVLDYPYAQRDMIAKMIPNELKITIEKALQMNPDLKKLYDSDAQIKAWLDMAMKLEGLPKATSVHAAGVVIYPGNASDFVPLGRSSDGAPTAQYNMVQLEELGYLKMDFLGLRTLTVIKDACKNVKASKGIDIDLESLDLNDKGTLEFIGTGKTQGVFQLESAGMANFMKELKPQSFEDIVAGISLYRPGPMDFIPAYIRGKQDPDSIIYACPQLEEILKPTYGTIVYQEQVMQIVQELAGYTMGQADNIRRAMSKKKQYVIDEERKSFVYGDEARGIAGCVKNGIDEKVANGIYDSMVDFAKYAFNKSHAAAYAVISYQTAYLKCYYPVEFMAALMTSVIDNSGKVAEYIQVCKGMDIEVLPPDINCGEGYFSVDDNSIRYGMYSVKSVGRPVVDNIIRERNARGPYKTLDDFITRVNGKEINKRTIENLIKAGAMDCLDGNRKQMVLVYPRVLDNINNEKKNSMAGQMTLFDIAPEETKSEFEIRMPDVEEYDKEMLLSLEKEVLGVYISGHPLQEYADIMSKNVTAKSSDFVYDEEEQKTLLDDESKAIIGGMITGKTIKYTRNNKAMAFITVEDLVGTVEVIIFPVVYDKYKDLLTEDAKVFVSGRVSAEDEKDAKLICDEIHAFDECKKELWIQFETMDDYESKKDTMFDLLTDSEGEDSLIIYISSEKKLRKMGDNWKIQVDDTLIHKLYGQFSEKNVKVVQKNIEFRGKRY